MRHMIQETITYTCHACDSINIIRNGTNKCGNQQYHCKDCGVFRVLSPKRPPSTAERETVLRAYQERMSLRGVERIFGFCRQTVMAWLESHVQSLPALWETLLPVQVNDVLELDEVWSFVAKRTQKRWLWTALCRRTRQIVAFVMGDHSEATCRHLWQAIPKAYRRCQTFSDFWKAYAAVLPTQTHQSVGKESGQTAHMERWYNTLRQRLGRYTRKSLSFSKTDYHHALVTRWFITDYNMHLLRSPLTT